MAERVIVDTPELTVVEITSGGWPASPGSTRIVRTTRKVHDPRSALEAARAELDRAVAVAAAPTEMAALNAAALAQEGVVDGQPWRQPAGAHNAYPLGFRVTHGGKTWENLTPANVWTPGVSGWREVTTSTAPAAWVQPTGAHDAYPVDARVTHQGQTWRNTSPANVYEPGVFGWVQV